MSLAASSSASSSSNSGSKSYQSSRLIPEKGAFLDVVPARNTFGGGSVADVGGAGRGWAGWSGEHEIEGASVEMAKTEMERTEAET